MLEKQLILLVIVFQNIVGKLLTILLKLLHCIQQCVNMV